jgi:hypothetical protein
MPSCSLSTLALNRNMPPASMISLKVEPSAVTSQVSDSAHEGTGIAADPIPVEETGPALSPLNGLSFGSTVKDLPRLLQVCLKTFPCIDIGGEPDGLWLNCLLKFNVLHLRFCRWSEAVLAGDRTTALEKTVSDVELAKCSLDNINYGIMRTAKFSAHGNVQDADSAMSSARASSNDRRINKIMDMVVRRTNRIRSNINEHIDQMKLAAVQGVQHDFELVTGNIVGELEAKPPPVVQCWKLENDIKAREMMEGLQDSIATLDSLSPSTNSLRRKPQSETSDVVRELVLLVRHTRPDPEILDALRDVEVLLADAVQSGSTTTGTVTGLAKTSKGEDEDVNLLDS